MGGKREAVQKQADGERREIKKTTRISRYSGKGIETGAKIEEIYSQKSSSMVKGGWW